MNSTPCCVDLLLTVVPEVDGGDSASFLHLGICLINWTSTSIITMQNVLELFLMTRDIGLLLLGNRLSIYFGPLEAVMFVN